MVYGNPFFQAGYQAFNQRPDLRGRQVSSFDEAKAAQIDFDGSVFYFPDISHDKIYTKQVMMGGTASVRTYAIVEEKEPVQPDYVTKAEFDSVVSELKSALKGVANAQPKPAAVSDNLVPSF